MAEPKHDTATPCEAEFTHLVRSPSRPRSLWSSGYSGAKLKIGETFTWNGEKWTIIGEVRSRHG